MLEETFRQLSSQILCRKAIAEKYTTGAEARTKFEAPYAALKRRSSTVRPIIRSLKSVKFDSDFAVLAEALKRCPETNRELFSGSWWLACELA